MKHSKPTNSSRTARLRPPLKINSVAELRELQRVMTTMLFRPLTAGSRMQRGRIGGLKSGDLAGRFIKPNDRLSSFERLEIYNRQYWFRVLDCIYDDYPALRAILGEKAFLKLAEAYLVKYPSRSFTLRNLGSRLEKFLRENPRYAGKRLALALDAVRFEWAQITAFDNCESAPLSPGYFQKANPAKLRLGLQPHIALLALDYPLDDFALAVKEHSALRGEASNAMDAAPKGAKLNKVPLPRKEKVYVAVHRHNNSLYYKRLEPEAFVLLNLLSRGMTLAKACEKALKKSKRNVDWTARLNQWFEDWSSLGWFCRPSRP